MSLEPLREWLGRVVGLRPDDPRVAVGALEVVLVLCCFFAARYLARRFRPATDEGATSPSRRGPMVAVAEQATTIAWLALVGVGLLAARTAGWPDRPLSVAFSLLLAWLVVALASRRGTNKAIARALALVVWTVAALEVLGWLDPTLVVLDQLAVQVGVVRVSALGVLKALATLAVLLWVATLASNLIEHRLGGVEDFSPSVRVLLGKLSRIALISLAVVIGVASAGFDLTAFAMFSGAVGLGVGFGLQKVVSNLVSGLILLLDKSIKPGDVIAVADYYGRVDALGARYVSVITRDGTEHLIPNEELVTSRVENWSHSQNLLRIRVPVGVHYKSDVKKAIALCKEAAAATPRILEQPATTCLMRGFGDSSVDLEIRFWINDPMNGRANVTSELLLGVWDRFHEHGIEIPYPQRDLHIRTPQRSIEVALERAPEGSGA